MSSRIKIVWYFIYDHPIFSALMLATALGAIYFGYRLVFAVGVVMEFWY